MEPAEAAEPHVAMRGVHLAFGERRVFQGVDCSFPRGAISVLMGGSGSGKSTLLRMIGGLQLPDRGEVDVAGEAVTRLSERELFRVRQRMGMLFQGGALLDSLSIGENVALPLEERGGTPAAEIRARVDEALEAVGLHDTRELLPGQLSGGMMRRAALARALVTRPEIVLCDEPFSGLDPPNVRRIEALLCRLNRDQGLTLLVTSHHVPSTLRMADRVVFLLGGEAVEGRPEELRSGNDERVVHFFEAETAEEVEEDEPLDEMPGVHSR